MSYAADDTQAIAQRLKEIEAEKQVALTGTSAPVAQEKDDTPSGYGDYLALKQWGTQVTADELGRGLFSLAHPEWPYAGTGFEWRKFVRS
jgi:hypothetical protein